MRLWEKITLNIKYFFLVIKKIIDRGRKDNKKEEDKRERKKNGNLRQK